MDRERYNEAKGALNTVVENLQTIEFEVPYFIYTQTHTNFYTQYLHTQKLKFSYKSIE